ncbi:MAG: NAD-glutamate dehydrogenase [Deltaproteobacteria bacterium]|nr:NAD-glutamate dehydrogenase [Deltaproteobacteria bacterium]
MPANLHSERKKQSKEKLSKLKAYFLGSNGGSTATKTIEPSAKADAALSSLASSLFSKAPIEFLERKSLEDLAHITELCSRAVNRLGENNARFFITSEQSERHTAFISVAADRPFIVNSLTESIEAFGLRLDVFLHPIFISDGYRISLVYVETEKITPQQADLLARQLECALDDLTHATDDFTAMLVRTETLAKLYDNPANRSNFPQVERQEVADFLRWLTDGGLVFLGFAEWKADQSGALEGEPAIRLGIFKSTQPYVPTLLQESLEDARASVEGVQPVQFSKLTLESLVHRRAKLNCISIPELTSEGRLVAVHSVVGLLTSKALAQESSSVPIIRRKLQKLIEVEEVVHNSHDYKYIVDIVDRMPKDQALRLDLEALREIIHTIIGLQNKSDTRVSLRFDSAKRGVSVLIVMPRSRFNSYVRAQIQQYVESVFGVAAGSSEYHLDLSNKPLARFYFYIPLADSSFDLPAVGKLEATISELTKTWEENLQERIMLADSAKNPNELWFKYSGAFPEDYQALQTIDECLDDINAIEQLSNSAPVTVNIYDNKESDGSHRTSSLVVYNIGTEISISKAFPVLENAGLEVISEKVSYVTPFGMQPVYIHRFIVKAKSGRQIDLDRSRTVLVPGLCKVLQDECDNDQLNALMLNASLDVRAIAVLRAYADFMWQISSFATRRSIFEAFASEPAIALQFWELFKLRFDPALQVTLEERRRLFRRSSGRFMDMLREVTDITKDRIFRNAVNILEHTVRTNHFHSSGPLALKIESELVEIMPQPRPKYEIFVHSSSLQGVHLRSAMIARGGIRWSDRLDDFRSEVLGLVKTQKIKNAVIVPNGAKGGFILPNLPKDQELIPAAVESGYREFIRALLSITDNIVGGTTRHPERLVIHDGEDPYLVVAADKGTASFSDVANAIATREFDFWLEDAFASGGSYGYDHKKYGITAKGAWQCVRRHFHETGIDYTNQEFTVVGIGDMSGDVFGNGLIASAKAKLIAAFNHKHIFIDPDPDPLSSFQERQRLFRMPKSQWSDYDKKLFSEGGGVYNRFDKEITLSQQARTALGIPADEKEAFSGERLIRYILKAPVDLLWNGGIGTYVKSKNETHAEVNDGTNDRVRVNAEELRCKVVGEGGNLGFTQQARIDFARLGGRINTDAIDNSAGVDLSDHEVNIKILFSRLIKEGHITKETRDEILTSIAPDVVDAVLTHNRNHAVLLSIGTLRSHKSIEYYRSLIQALHKMGYINRNLECLPDEDELQDRIAKRQGLVGPELAICMAGVKMWIKEVLFDSPLCGDARLEEFLLDYFPPRLQHDFRDEILRHPLARSIVASQVANNLIDTVGITFVHRMCLTYSARPIIVLKCLLAANFILEIKQLRSSLECFDNFSQNKIFLALRQGVGKTLRDATSWIISAHGDQESLGEIVNLYRSSFATLISVSDGIFSGTYREQYFERLQEFRRLRLDERSAKTLAIAPNIIPVLEMLWASRTSGKDITDVAKVFSQVQDEIGINAVLKLSSSIETTTKWEHQSLLSSFEEIRRSVSLITCELLNRGTVEPQEVTERLRKSSSFEELQSIIEEMKSGPFGAAGLSIIAKQLAKYRL